AGRLGAQGAGVAAGARGPVHGASGGASEARLAAEQGEPFPSPVQALRGHLPAPGDGIDLPGEVADLVLHQGVGDGAISDASRPSPRSLGPCSDLQALLAQDAEERLDSVTLAPHLVDALANQRLRGTTSPATIPDARHS